MSEAEIHNLLLQNFTAWFNSDLVNIDSEESIDGAIGGAAADLYRAANDPTPIVGYIHKLLTNWTDQLALEFDHAALQVWFDEGRTEQLKTILSGIASELEWHGKHSREHLSSGANI
jgi:hypothetical protein